MASFNLLNLFSPSARNMLLAKPDNVNGVQNMLMTQPVPQDRPVVPMQPDPQTTAAVAGLAPQPIPASAPQVAGGGGREPLPAVPEKPGGIDKYTKDIFRENLNQFFLGMAMGRNPTESIALGAAAANEKHNSMKNGNQTVAWLMSKGMDKEQAWQLTTNPSALGEYIKSISMPAEKKSPLEINGRLVDPTDYHVIADFSDPTAKLTSDQREYDFAKTQGYNGSFVDYQRMMKGAGRSQVNIDNGTIPQGYQADRDENGRILKLSPIPGGPADGTQKAAATADSKNTFTDVITNAAERARAAMDGATLPVTGTMGAIAAVSPSTGAAEVRRQVGVLKSNATIENLNAMRQQSPTGGALGNVTEGEGQMLSAKAGALDPNSPNFSQDLDDYERTLLRIVHGKDKGDEIYASTRKTAPSGNAKKTDIAPPAGIDPSVWSVMTPEEKQLWQN